MATDSIFVPASAREPTYRPVNRTVERVFYSGMAILLCVCVYIGFSPTYFQAGMSRAPLPSPILHIHGAVFTLWMLLFVVQAALISARRVKWHRSFGTVAFCLPPIMIVLGVIAAIDALHRGVKIGPLDPAVSAAIPLIGIVGFTIVIYASWRARQARRAQASDPDRHLESRRRRLRPLSLGPHRISARRWSRHRPRHPASHSRRPRSHLYPPHPPLHHVGRAGCLRYRRPIRPHRNDPRLARLRRIAQPNHRVAEVASNTNSARSFADLGAITSKKHSERPTPGLSASRKLASLTRNLTLVKAFVPIEESLTI